MTIRNIFTASVVSSIKARKTLLISERYCSLYIRQVRRIVTKETLCLCLWIHIYVCVCSRHQSTARVHFFPPGPGPALFFHTRARTDPTTSYPNPNRTRLAPPGTHPAAIYRYKTPGYYFYMIPISNFISYEKIYNLVS